MPSDHENDYKSWACEFYDLARSSYSQDELFMIQCEIVGIVSFLSSEGLSWRVNTKMNTKHTLIANTRIFPISFTNSSRKGNRKYLHASKNTNNHRGNCIY